METAEQTTMRTRDQIEEMLFDVNAINQNPGIPVTPMQERQQESSRAFRLGVIQALIWVLDDKSPSFLETWVQRNK